jgi:hypothetical protein
MLADFEMKDNRGLEKSAGWSRRIYRACRFRGMFNPPLKRLAR